MLSARHSRFVRFLLAAAWTLLTLFGARDLSAQVASFRLDWSAPPECPQWREALSRIETLLGARVDEVRHAALSVRASVTKAGERYTVSLETLHAENRFERSLEAKTCSEVTDAGALVIALAIDPTLAERRKPDAPPAPPPVATPCPAAPEPPPCPKLQPATRIVEREVIVEREILGNSWSAEAFAHLDVGTLPEVGFGPRVGVVGSIKWWQAGLLVTWLAPRRGYVEGRQEGGDVSLLAAQLRSCVAPWRQNFTGRVCGGLEVGMLRAQGVGTTRTVSAASPWVAPTAEILGGYSFSDELAAELSAGAVIPLERPEFTVQNIGPVHQAKRLVLRLGIGATVHF